MFLSSEQQKRCECLKKSIKQSVVVINYETYYVRQELVSRFWQTAQSL